MPVSMLNATREALGADAARCTNRSLFIDRFSDPLPSDTTSPTRKDWFNALISPTRKPAVTPSQNWHPPTANVLHARLMDRLMINMAGGVMENAGLLLDRYGLPFIPGSAVKGCARRMALQALHDWVESGGERPSAEDIGLPCCAKFARPSDMLAAIALIFGWVERDWNDDSDFAWACGKNSANIWTETNAILFAAFHREPPESPPWKKLPNFAGSIAFLPARPNADPGIELDVVTPHHTDYYRGKKDVATDTEDPVPVFFPAVKAQKDSDFFTFTLIPLRHSSPEGLQHARTWLAHGLAIFGLGAKTNAGYGWFDSSEGFNHRLETRIKQKCQAEADEKRRLEQLAAEKAEAEAKLRQKRDLEQALAGLTPDEQEDKRIALLTDSQFDTKVLAFLKEKKKGGPTDSERQAIVRALRGPRLAYWQAFKTRATKGELATIDQAIRALSKTMTLGKMP